MSEQEAGGVGLDLDALEAKAKNAQKETPGPWTNAGWLVYRGVRFTPSGQKIAQFDTDSEAVPEYVAVCDPDTVLELIADLRRYRDMVHKLYGLHLANDPEFQKQAAEARRMMEGLSADVKGEPE